MAHEKQRDFTKILQSVQDKWNGTHFASKGRQGKRHPERWDRTPGLTPSPRTSPIWAQRAGVVVQSGDGYITYRANAAGDPKRRNDGKLLLAV